MDKKYCRGCRDKFYNGNNGIGVNECWNLKDAKREWRIPVGMQEPPPYKNRKKVKIPTCYYGEGAYRTIYIKPDALTKDGFWKNLTLTW